MKNKISSQNIKEDQEVKQENINKLRGGVTKRLIDKYKPYNEPIVIKNKIRITKEKRVA